MTFRSPIPEVSIPARPFSDFVFAGVAFGRLAWGDPRPPLWIGLGTALFAGGLVADRLLPGGVLHVATDHPGYAEHIAEVGDDGRLAITADADAITPVEIEEFITKGTIWDGMTIDAWGIVRKRVREREELRGKS